MLMIESFAAADGEVGENWPNRAVTAAGVGPEALLAILRPETNLAIWLRPLPRTVKTATQALLDAAPFVTTVEDAPVDAVDALARALPAEAPLHLLADIWSLAETFAGLAETGGPVRIRLEGITGRGCHRWHADAIGLRMLCTYRGAGTLALPMDGGARRARGLEEDALPTEAIRIPAGAVAILKGEGHGGNGGSGCIHRSPDAGNRARLLLCLDTPGRIPLE